MKILYLCSWYRENPKGFSGVFFAEQAAVFAEKGHDVAIASCDRLSFRRPRLPRKFSISKDEILTSGIKSPVYRGQLLAAPGEQFGWIQKCNSRAFGNFLCDVVKDFGRPDLVHIQSSVSAGIYGFPWLEKANIPYIITEHATYFRRGLLKPWSLSKVRECFAGSHRGLAVSSALRNDLINAGVNSPIDIMPNMYDDKFFKLTSRPSQQSEFVFLLVCGLKQKKRVDLAIESFALIQKSVPKSRLLIAGNGAERESLERLTLQRGLSKSIDFLGQCSRQDVSGLMSESHCLLSTSQFETFGVTLIEALASGLAVIATTSGGPEDFVKAPFGELVPLDDTQALADSMLRMIENYDYSDAASEARHMYAKKNFSGAALYARLMPIYEAASSSDSIA